MKLYVIHIKHTSRLKNVTNFGSFEYKVIIRSLYRQKFSYNLYHTGDNSKALKRLSTYSTYSTPATGGG